MESIPRQTQFTLPTLIRVYFCGRLTFTLSSLRPLGSTNKAKQLVSQGTFAFVGVSVITDLIKSFARCASSGRDTSHIVIVQC